MAGRNRPLPLLVAAAVLLSPGCAGKKPKYETVNYEAAKLATPPHNMERHEYPFDDWGRYRKDWVKRSGSDAPKTRTRSSSSRSSGSSYAAASVPKPAVTPAPKPKPKPAARYHTVKKGDTLYAIGRKYGVTVSAVKSTNGLRSDLIRIGQTLRIPR